MVLWLTVRYVDAYIERGDESDIESSLCLGATALFLAVKLQECSTLRAGCQLEHIVEIGEETFNSEAVLIMEQRLLNTFDGMINLPTIYHFLAHFVSLLEADGVIVGIGIEQLSSYYAESTLISTSFSRLKTSRIAAGVLFAALLCRDQHCWSIPRVTRSNPLGSPVAVTVSLSPQSFSSPPSSREIYDQIVTSLDWLPPPILPPGSDPSSLWLPSLSRVTELDAVSLKLIATQVVTCLVHPRDEYRHRSAAYEKYASRKRFSVSNLRPPDFSLEIPSPTCSLSSTVLYALAPRTPSLLRR
jgi:hypothetical protein